MMTNLSQFVNQATKPAAPPQFTTARGAIMRPVSLDDKPPRVLVAANDNRTVRMIPHNGGCSTTSGMVPVTLARSAQPVEVAA
jgi:hypothetical protein